MQLTVKEVAKLLNVNEKTIYRWLKNGELPAYRIGNYYRFNKAELLEWVTANKVNVPLELWKDSSQQPGFSIGEAMKSGGIYYRTEGTDKESVIRNVIGLMKLPSSIDREYLLKILLAREALASTAIGDGIAIPHVRDPIVLQIMEPVISLCFIDKPVDFNSLDNKPVFCLFTLISPTVKAHLFLLSRLAYLIRDDRFRSLLKKQGSRDEIFSEISRIESALSGKNHVPATGVEN